MSGESSAMSSEEDSASESEPTSMGSAGATMRPEVDNFGGRGCLGQDLGMPYSTHSM